MRNLKDKCIEREDTIVVSRDRGWDGENGQLLFNVQQVSVKNDR